MMALSSYRPKTYFNHGKTLNYGEDISSNDMGTLRRGEILTLLDPDGVPIRLIFMDSYNQIRENRIRYMISKSSHTLIFIWYLMMLDAKTQQIFRGTMANMCDPDIPEQDRYDAYVHLYENMIHLTRKQASPKARLQE